MGKKVKEMRTDIFLLSINLGLTLSKSEFDLGREAKKFLSSIFYTTSTERRRRAKLQFKNESF